MASKICLEGRWYVELKDCYDIDGVQLLYQELIAEGKKEAAGRLQVQPSSKASRRGRVQIFIIGPMTEREAVSKAGMVNKFSVPLRNEANTREAREKAQAARAAR